MSGSINFHLIENKTSVTEIKTKKSNFDDV